MCDSTTTVKRPDPTPAELEAQSKISAATTAAMAELGYVERTVTEQQYKNPDAVASLEATVSDLTNRVADLDAQILVEQDRVNRGASADKLQSLQQQKASFTTQINAKQSQLDGEKKNSTTVYKTTYEDADVAKLRDEGKTAEADALANSRAQSATELRQGQDEVASMVIEATKKYLKTDWNKELSDSTKAIQGPVLEMLDKLSGDIKNTQEMVGGELAKQGAEITATFEGTNAALQGVLAKIKETGLSTQSAIAEAAVRAKAGNLDLNTALDKTIEASRTLAEQGLFEQTRSLRNNIALRAAATGRSDLDPAFVRELNDKTLESARNVELSLAVTQAQGRLALGQDLEKTLQSLDVMQIQNTEQTGRRQEAVGAEQAALTERTGLRREELASTRAGLAERTGIAEQGVTGMRAQLLESTLAEQEARRLAILSGLPPTAAGVSNQLSANVGATSTIGNIATGTQAIGADLAGLRSIRGSEGTYTESGSVFGSILAGIGGLGSSAGTVMTGIGALRG